MGCPWHSTDFPASRHLQQFLRSDYRQYGWIINPFTNIPDGMLYCRLQGFELE